MSFTFINVHFKLLERERERRRRMEWPGGGPKESACNGVKRLQNNID